MKSYEIEAFLKSFSLFFVVQLTFLTLVMWQYHKNISHQYEMKIMHEIRQCSYSLDCKKYEMSFINNSEGRELNSLYKSDEYYMLFSSSTSEKTYLKLSLSKQKYNMEYDKIFYDNLLLYLFFTAITVLISVLFARFALRPLHEALNLNDEFVKDMLHDFNTPLSSLKINFKILQKKFGKDEAITRSEEAMKTINDLQSNLSYFLSHSLLSEEKLELCTCLEQRVKSYEVLFTEVDFFVDIEEVYLKINPEAFVRIVDNLLSNAAKYNVPNGKVHISFIENILIIEDTGIGIKEPLKVFNRFYKETSRGMGIGLHIVKKLCDDLKIEIKVESQLKKGTKFSLNLEKLMFN